MNYFYRYESVDVYSSVHCDHFYNYILYVLNRIQPAFQLSSTLAVDCTGPQLIESVDKYHINQRLILNLVHLGMILYKYNYLRANHKVSSVLLATHFVAVAFIPELYVTESNFWLGILQAILTAIGFWCCSYFLAIKL